MGIMDFIKGQFIEVIEWLDDKGVLVHRFEAYDNAIKMGAKLVVRESQAAIFVNEGQLADVFGPGTYTLSTQNMPVLTALKSWKYSFNSPFKADVFFVNMTNFTDLKWGTTNPVIMRDADFGMVRIRGFGNYSVKVGDPAIFLKEIFGTKKEFTTDSITGFLKTIIVSSLSDLLGESKIPIADLSSSYDELGVQSTERLQPKFEAIGLKLTSLTIENISLPEDVEKMIDRRSSMNVLGNMDNYMKFQTAEAIRDAANNEGSGGAGLGAGMGAGMAMGQMMGQMFQPNAAANANANAMQQQAQQQQQTQPAVVPSSGDAGIACSNAQCGHLLQPSEKFCVECGSPRAQKRFCTQCGHELSATAKFCSDCGSKA
ncbi:SPFH domain-containing protein [Cohnella yongneupensis]|uniref:SPFH domain-containing protein n=1 Tax=Cohnella yongneupensis TaxID=425006 RepID=A0ABW0QVA6_9BACL